MRQLGLTVSPFIAALLIGCGSGTSGTGEVDASPFDVKVIDGYVVEGNVTDNDGQQASADADLPGLYHFASAPVYPIRFTVGTGYIVDSNMMMDINMSATEGTVISPITTIVGNDAMIASNLVSVMGMSNDSDLFGDYIAWQNLELAKLSQLCYAMLKDTNATQSFISSISTGFDPSADQNVTTLIDNTVKNSVSNASTKVFLWALNGYDNTIASMESILYDLKSTVGYSYKVDDQTLRELIGQYLDCLQYGWTVSVCDPLPNKIKYADTSSVTTMHQLFYNTDFDLDIRGWDTSNVTNMSGMFQGATAFNHPLNWDTSNVTNMSHMFDAASAFNQPIGDWNTSKVTDMSYMFTGNGTSTFNQPIGGWDTSKVVNMSYMFANALIFNQPIGGWNTANVANMSAMFRNARAFNQPLGGWDTSNVTDMSGMFTGAFIFNQPLGDWNTSNVITMSNMFDHASLFNQPLGGWDTAKVGNMQSMFYYAELYYQDLSDWNVTRVGSTHSGFDWYAAFYGVSSLLPQWVQ